MRTFGVVSRTFASPNLSRTPVCEPKSRTRAFANPQGREPNPEPQGVQVANLGLCEPLAGANLVQCEPGAGAHPHIGRTPNGTEGFASGLGSPQV